MASTQVERKFFWQQQKYSLVEKKELEELDKNVTSLLLVIRTPLLNHLNVFSKLHLLRPTVYLGPKNSCFIKDQLLSFTFNTAHF